MSFPAPNPADAIDFDALEAQGVDGTLCSVGVEPYCPTCLRTLVSDGWNYVHTAPCEAKHPEDDDAGFEWRPTGPEVTAAPESVAGFLMDLAERLDVDVFPGAARALVDIIDEYRGLAKFAELAYFAENSTHHFAETLARDARDPNYSDDAHRRGVAATAARIAAQLELDAEISWGRK